MEINVDEIKLSDLNIGGFGYSVLELIINPALESNREITDEMYSYIVNPPPIYMSAQKDIEERAKKRTQKYLDDKPNSLKLVKLIKGQFYEFICTESEYYKKERTAIGGNINVLITGVSAAIATKLGNVEIGVVTSFVVCFMTVLAKMGKKTMCEYMKPIK